MTNARRGGNAGSIRLTVADNIRISGNYPTFDARLERINRYIRSNPFEQQSDALWSRETASGLFASTTSQSQARGGNIEVNTANLDLSNGSRISAQSQGSGQAGDIRLNVTDQLTAIALSLKRPRSNHVLSRPLSPDLKPDLKNVPKAVLRQSG
ncbi:hypothetical protein [Leptolyngbya sp. 7M]|uniref:hypothetical protein n=1 Tax=Leptolyngbya sp. 7M TaxID=2812896 RepID=UPI001B8AC3DE|nr:hypothetical protein [Leptolyngbya sp. 7M]QYO64240.1 hypothetical protein JVX88_31685 [Leptolyngbya sp. 7M]